jgi:hypothetical protein
LRKPTFLLWFLGTLLLMTGAAQGQTQLDMAFGVGTVIGTSANNADANHFPQNVGGGAFPAFSGDFVFHRHLGIYGEVAWRASRGLYQGFIPFRPIFYDFGAVYAPPLGKHATLEVLTGIGGESVRFYTGTVNCSFFSCTNFTSTNHFLWQIGGGARLYVWHNAFIRPEVRYYWINNNTQFSSNHATRVGASLGYSFGR